MHKIKKIIAFLVCAALIATMALSLTGCEVNGTYQDVNNTKKVTENLQEKQPTPTDIEYSLQRYNLIRRAYWVNGQREKAMALPCEIEKPLGYIYFFLEGVGCITRHTVDGQITSLQTYLTPDTTTFLNSSDAKWLADVDGTYGENQPGIFFFDETGHYHEWNGLYYYADILYEIDDPVLKTVEVGGETK